MEKIFYIRLKKCRTACGLSQSGAAKAIAAHIENQKFVQQAYSRIENGKGEPTLAQLIAICKVFSVSADWLLGLSDGSEQKQSEIRPSFNARLDDVKRNAKQATESFKELQSAIEKLGRII